MKFNKEKMNLEHLAEEAAEVIRIKSKCIRFGMDDFHPKNGHINRKALAMEIGNMKAMVQILIANGTLNPADIELGVHEKYNNLEKWYDAETVKNSKGIGNYENN